MYKSELFKEVSDYTDYFVPAGYGVDVNVNSNDVSIGMYRLLDFASGSGFSIINTSTGYPSRQAYPRRYIINPKGYNRITLYGHTNRQCELNIKAYAIVKEKSSNVYKSIEIVNIGVLSTAGISKSILLSDEQLEDTKLIIISMPNGTYAYSSDLSMGLSFRLHN